MHKISFEIQVADSGKPKKMEWKGYSVDGVPGLGVCKTPRHLSTWQAGPGWQIIHLGSGLLVGPRIMDRRKDAMELATMLGEVCDWTLTNDELSGFGIRIRETIGRFRYGIR